MNDINKDLKLLIDVKYGYENRYIVLKDYELYLDWLTDTKIYDQLQQLTQNKLTFQPMSPQEIVDKYAANPENLIKDHSLTGYLELLIFNDLAIKYFPETLTTDLAKRPLNFPELFVLRNVRLDYPIELQASFANAAQAEQNDNLNLAQADIDTDLDDWENSDLDTNTNYDA